MELRPSKRGDPACSAVLLGGSGPPPEAPAQRRGRSGYSSVPAAATRAHPGSPVHRYPKERRCFPFSFPEAGDPVLAAASDLHSLIHPWTISIVVVPLIWYAFIGCLLYAPWAGIEPATLAYRMLLQPMELPARAATCVSRWGWEGKQRGDCRRLALERLSNEAFTLSASFGAEPSIRSFLLAPVLGAPSGV